MEKIDLTLFSLPELKARKTLASDKIRSERASVIKDMLDRLNSDRPGSYIDAKGKKKLLPLLTPRAVAVKCSHLNLQDLYYLHSVCSKDKCYSKRWFWELRA